MWPCIIKLNLHFRLKWEQSLYVRLPLLPHKAIPFFSNCWANVAMGDLSSPVGDILLDTPKGCRGHIS